MVKTIDVPIGSITRDITLRFELSGVAQWRSRLWIAARLMRLAGAIAGCAVEITTTIQR